MWFNQYPYINLTDLNLDFIYKSIKELRYQLENFININTIKYANPIQWNITTQYEANTVVIDANDGTAYLSVKPVPSGVAITNTDYWTPIFTLNLLSANQNITLRDDGSNVLATFASVAGDWLIWNNTLYRVTQTINTNEAYVVGYNLERFSVELFIKDYIATVIAMIGDLNDLETTDKSDIVSAINELHAVVVGLESFLTFEAFGAVGDGVTDDTNAIKAALLAAKAQHKALTCCGGTYLISDDLTVDGVDLYNINKIIGNGEYFNIRNRSTIKNVSLEKIAVKCDNYHVLVDGLGINNHGGGVGFEIETNTGGAFDDSFKHGTLISNVMINNHNNLTAISTGFIIPYDCVLFNCEVVDCMTAYRINGNAKLIACTCWVSGILSSNVLNWNDTIAYYIAGIGALLSDCTADSMAQVIYANVTGMSYTVKGFKFINNNTIVTNKEFYLLNNSGAAIGDITLILTGFAAAGNHITIGHKDRLYIAVVDAGAALRDRVDGFGATVTNNPTINRASYYNENNMISLSFRCTWNALADFPPIANAINVTPSTPCVDLGMITNVHFNAWVVAYNTSQYLTQIVAADAYFDGSKFVITPYLNPSGYDTVRALHFDVTLPITKPTI